MSQINLDDIAGLDRFNNKWKLNLQTWCWEWVGAKVSNGYGQLRVNLGIKENKTFLAHRLSYVHYIGAIPDNLIVDHICHVRCCVNPEHLQLVTHQQNSMFSITRDKSHSSFKKYCKRGHERTENNIYVIKATNARQCLECIRLKSRAATMGAEALERRREYDRNRRCRNVSNIA